MPLKQLNLSKNDLENIFRTGIRTNFKIECSYF